MDLDALRVFTKDLKQRFNGAISLHFYSQFKHLVEYIRDIKRRMTLKVGQIVQCKQ